LKTLRVFFVAVVVAAGTYAAAPELSSVIFAGQGSKAESGESAVLKDFAAIQPIDAHIHVNKDDPELNALIERLNLRALNICVIDNPDTWGLEPQRSYVLKVRQSTRGRVAFCTTFSPYDFEEPGFSARAIRQLNQDFANGAVAVKIYKVMGMAMKSKAGKWVMADDPAFEPIYQDIAAHNRTVVAHLAEPDSSWQAPNPASPDYDYYKWHPEEYAYAHPDWPSKAAILAARDHLVAENHKLRVVGAHLGSMETNVDDIAQRLNRYPNFAVDMAARVPYFMLQPREKVRAFLIKYQDRVLYATDLGVMPQAETESALAEFRNTYERDWKFFSTSETVEYMGHIYQGLALPRPVLKKLFHDNAVRWFPGIMGAAETTKTKLTDWERFQASLVAIAPALAEFRGCKLLEMSESQYSEAVSRLRACYQALDLSMSGATIVVNSKAFYHLLPDFIPPINRQYTIRFFRHAPEAWRDTKGKFRMISLPSGIDAQYSLFHKTCVDIKRLADRIDPALFETERRQHQVTAPEALDSAIVSCVRIVSAAGLSAV